MENPFGNSGGAPGWPGIAPTWTSSAKDLVTTALGPGRVWVTLGHGIVNEVYWPRTGLPQIRDLGFIVAREGEWHEVKRARRYTLSLAAPCVPLPRVVHEGDGYRLEVEVLPDPLRDAVLLRYRLEGAGWRLYVLLAPHLNGSGRGNSARAGALLTAFSGDAALCLAADHAGFSRTSAGYVGQSDGWQDFARNGAMTWRHASADDGNVALFGELAQNEGVMALAFAFGLDGAVTLARSALHAGYHAARRRFIAGWQHWRNTLRMPELLPPLRDEAWLSASMLRVHEDRSYPGALVASLSIPWGNSSDNVAGYHMVWPRDAVESSLALAAIGQLDDARRVLAYLLAIQREDGGWCQNGFPDGRAFWRGVQLDEAAFPVLLAAKLHELGALEADEGLRRSILRAAAFLARRGPASEQDRWEELAGISPFTLGVMIAALVGAAGLIGGEEAAYLLSLADYWNERIEDWTYVEKGEFAELCGVAGHYVRIGRQSANGGLRGRIDLRNRPDESIEVARLIGLEFLYLVRLGLRAADDPRILGSLRVADDLLAVDTPNGVAWRRYNGDGYGEHEDGRPYDGTGVGRPWPLLAGERGHYEVQAGRDPMPQLEAMLAMSGPCGMIPEQVWDAAPIPARNLYPGKPTGSAMPLAWAHAEFVKLLVTRQTGKPVELLRAVERRYGAARPRAAAWHWRTEAPFERLPPQREFLVEGDEAFLLHAGFDGWRAAFDRASAPLGCGRHGVRLAPGELAGHATLQFKRFFPAAARWEESEHEIALGAPGAVSGATAAGDEGRP